MTTGLQFMEGGDKISPTECVRKYEDTGHETIVRELTQNALDAAREAGRDCMLRFEIRQLPTDHLPGIGEYRRHLQSDYMREWKQKGHKYREVIGRLYEHAHAETTECLLVFDNGVGLDAGRMEGLIGRGDSGKGERDGASGGTHGVGHETAFAAGDMHYVLYGGVNERRQMAASGHVVFPTHLHPPKTRWSGHGYLSPDVAQITLSGVAIITGESGIPRLIRGHLQDIGAKYGSGSVVIIPGFNRFPGDGDGKDVNICALICKDIAKHFFVAIAQDRLNVFVEDFVNGTRGQLDNADDVERWLARVREEKRASGNRLVAGARSHEAWLGYRQGQEHTLRTSYGAVQARIRYHEGGNSRPSRIAIMRAGMFITDNPDHMPSQMARQKFGDCRPFHAVLLFADDLKNATRADNILRAAENAGHSSIHRSMREGDGQHVPRLFEELKEALQAVLEKTESSDSYTPDFLPIRIEGEVPAPQPSLRPQLKQDSPVRPRNPRDDPQPRPSRPAPRAEQLVRATVVPVGAQRYIIEIVLPEHRKRMKAAFLHLQPRTGSDASCEAPLRSEPLQLDPARSRRDGVPLDDSCQYEVPLGALEPGQCVHLSLQLATGSAQGQALRAIVYRTAPRR